MRPRAVCTEAEVASEWPHSTATQSSETGRSRRATRLRAPAARRRGLRVRPTRARPQCTPGKGQCDRPVFPQPDRIRVHSARYVWPADSTTVQRRSDVRGAAERVEMQLRIGPDLAAPVPDVTQHVPAPATPRVVAAADVGRSAKHEHVVAHADATAGPTEACKRGARCRGCASVVNKRRRRCLRAPCGVVGLPAHRRRLEVVRCTHAPDAISRVVRPITSPYLRTGARRR